MTTLRFRVPILILAVLFEQAAGAAALKVMRTGLGSGTVTSSITGINCGASCDSNYASTDTVTLTATPAAGSTFTGWGGDCSAASCTVAMNVKRSVRAEFALTAAIPTISTFTAAGIQAYLTANPTVNSAARFIKALPPEYKQNWILMSRSESLQTGTAEFPRIFLPSADARFVFTVGLATNSSYPGAHPNAMEFMQWDPVERNFRFHEIVLDAIPVMGSLPARARGVSPDDVKCGKCHSTRNIINLTSLPGTTGIPPGTVKFKNKPNWDAYDSWAGMMPFNRDRIYNGSVEAAAFRKIFNPWTWRINDPVRSIFEQLELQPPSIPATHAITRTISGGTNDGQINFPFDTSPPVLTEPAPSGTPTAPITYSFDRVAGIPPGTTVLRDTSFITLHHSVIPTSDEGRGVRLFDALGGLAGNLNPLRIADEVSNHRFATGSVPIDVRPIALAITKGCLNIDTTANTVTSTPGLTIDLSFFTARNGMTINDLFNDTTARAQSLPRRKADIEKSNLDRTGDPYLFTAANGLIQQFGVATAAGLDTALGRLRQEVFRRPIDLGAPDSTVMGGVFVDREQYGVNTPLVTLFRYFLEPLGVSVDKWSMGVRGRSRTYTFADVFGQYENTLIAELSTSLGLPVTAGCATLIPAVNSTLATLPPANAVPTYTDVQRIFNKGCIECHGGLQYPPYYATGTLNFSENELPTGTDRRLTRSHSAATSYTTTDPATSYLYQRITDTTEDCPSGLMPCGGPALSKVDVETIRRWIVGARPYSEGDPHINTIDEVKYDFQGAGEYVLLRGENLEIQTRQTPVGTESPLGPNDHTGLTSCVSLNTAIAIRVGTHRITYEPNLNGEPDPSGLQLRIDGKLTKMAAGGIILDSGERITATTAPGGIQIQALGGSVVVVTPFRWDYHQLWFLNVDVRNARATEGLMGSIAPGNWLPALPDGGFMGARPLGLPDRYKQLYGTFGNAWRVKDAISLFDYAPGTSTKTFVIENWPGNGPKSCALPQREGAPPNKPPLKSLPLEVATKHCADVVTKDRKANCVQDVMVTGEPGFAKAYLLTDQIERQKMPAPPVLDLPAHSSDLSNDITFTWKPTELDGPPLTYKYCVWATGEKPNYNECVAASNKIPSWWSGGMRNAGLVALIGCLLLALLFFAGMKGKGILGFVALATLAGVMFAFYIGRISTLSNTVAKLEPGKAYLWKVIAEDDKGASVESETRRFTVK